jgi:hypothetical protein
MRWCLRLASLTVLAVVAGCATAPVETPAETLARRTGNCQQAGFAPDTAELRLCLLLQETNDRLDVMERRLRFIEQDVQFPRPYFGRYGWW